MFSPPEVLRAGGVDDPNLLREALLQFTGESRYVEADGGGDDIEDIEMPDGSVLPPAVVGGGLQARALVLREVVHTAQDLYGQSDRFSRNLQPGISLRNVMFVERALENVCALRVARTAEGAVATRGAIPTVPRPVWWNAELAAQAAALQDAVTRHV
jgi:hypothetical protein